MSSNSVAGGGRAVHGFAPERSCQDTPRRVGDQEAVLIGAETFGL